MTCDDIGFAADKTFIDVVGDGFEQIEDGEGFEYIVGHIKGGKLKIVFEPTSDDHNCAVIDGVEGLGYTLAFNEAQQAE